MVKELFTEKIVEDLTFEEILAQYRTEGQELYRPYIYQGIIREAEVQAIARGSEIAIQGWQHDMAFSATDHDTVAWASGTITLLDGTTYSITGANTGTMSAITYIYLDIATSTTALQTTTTASTAAGTGKILVAVAQNVASGKKAIFQVFGGKALGGMGKLITADDITANIITANEIYANTITSSEISTGLYNEISANLPSDENLVAYWNFDEGEVSNGVHDGSENGHDGTLEGTMTDADFVQGVAGTCLDFEGTDDYVSIADHNDFSFGNGSTDSAFSISAWIYMDNSGVFYILGKHSAGKEEWGFGIVSGKLYMVCYDASASARIGRYYNTALSTGQWYYTTATYDGGGASSGIKIYANGTQVDDTDYNDGSYTAMENLTEDVWIGRYTTNYANGKIDEVRLYNKELTAKEVYALYKNPAGSKTPIVPMGRLVSGSIYSKQINLAVAAGTGDSYIAAGKTDFDNTVTGFIIGLDDSDSDLPKFYMGTTTEYINFTGSTWVVAVPINHLAGDILASSNDDSKEVNSDTYIKAKETDTKKGGTFRIKFTLTWGSAAGTTYYGKIYRNGSPVGTERSVTSGSEEFSEDISGWSPGDSVQIYVHNQLTQSGDNPVLTNFRIYVLNFDEFDNTVT